MDLFKIGKAFCMLTAGIVVIAASLFLLYSAIMVKF